MLKKQSQDSWEVAFCTSIWARGRQAVEVCLHQNFSYLCIDVREFRVNLLSNDRPALSGEGSQLGDRESSVTVRLGEVLRGFALETEILNEANVHGGCPSVGSFDKQTVRLAFGELRLQIARWKPFDKI